MEVTTRPVCIIGEVLVDVMVPGQADHEAEVKMRLGGVFHAARALWAIGCPYTLAYLAPSYLDDQIQHYAKHHGATCVSKVGSIVGCPNVMLVREATEAGPQGYEYLLRDEHNADVDIEALTSALQEQNCSDVLVFPGGFDLRAALGAVASTSARVYLDANFSDPAFDQLSPLGRPLDVFILSTSSPLFLDHWGGDVSTFCRDVVGNYATSALLKENRGGSRFFPSSDASKLTRVPAQVQQIVHSVGVGDCYDAVFAHMRHKVSDRAALCFASLIAAEYASTTFPDDFKTAVQGVLSISSEEIETMRGVQLPWEDRPSYQIYMAAPDFDFVDTRPFDQLVRCLKYHNFSPRCPVREHGQIGKDADPSERQATHLADMRLLRQSQMLVAVMLYDDPGTLIEIGLAHERGIPVIVYDPYHRAENLMLTELPELVTSDLDEIIARVFTLAAEAPA